MNERLENDPAIEARGLVKRYGDEVVAVDGVDLSIPANRIYGLLGPNGAGKTTTISILTTLLEPTAGEAKVLGLDVVKQAGDVRQRVGVTFQEMVLDDELTGRQVLDYHGRLYRMGKTERKAKTEELLALVELEEAAERKAKTYSGGMKRRLELARALMTTPEERAEKLPLGVGMKSMLSADMPGSGEPYVTFMLPGIVVLSALGGAIGGGSVWLTERLRGIVKEYLVAPIPRLSILMGNALSTMTKSMFQAIIILIVGVVLGAKLNANPLGWLGGLVLVAGFGLGFSGIALSMASQTDNPGAYHAMIMVFNLPLLFLSNALYPLTTMPTWMRIGSLLNPTTYTIDGLRQMMFRNPAAMAGGDPLPLWLCWGVVLAFAALGMWLAYAAFRKSIK